MSLMRWLLQRFCSFSLASLQQTLLCSQAIESWQHDGTHQIVPEPKAAQVIETESSGVHIVLQVQQLSSSG